jgi:hypothetical protein
MTIAPVSCLAKLPEPMCEAVKSGVPNYPANPQAKPVALPETSEFPLLQAWASHIPMPATLYLIICLTEEKARGSYKIQNSKELCLV